jgi:transcriptional regulator NrdR family protein
MRTPSCEILVWPVWYKNSYLLRVRRWCDHCDMRTPSCETLVWPSWYENTFVWDAGVTFVICELLPARRWCDHCDMRTPSCETLVWRYSHIIKVTAVSHTKLFSKHNGHSSIWHEGVLISERSYQRLTRRCSHIIKAPSCETLMWPLWYENTFVCHACVAFVIWEHLRVRRWCGLCHMTTLRVRRWCGLCDMRTPSYETLMLPSHTKVFSYHDVHTSVSNEGVLISQRSHQCLTRRCSNITKVSLASTTWYEKNFVSDDGVTFVIWEHLRVRCWCEHCDARAHSCETLVWPFW